MGRHLTALYPAECVPNIIIKVFKFVNARNVDIITVNTDILSNFVGNTDVAGITVDVRYSLAIVLQLIFVGMVLLLELGLPVRKVDLLFIDQDRHFQEITNLNDLYQEMKLEVLIYEITSFKEKLLLYLPSGPEINFDSPRPKRFCPFVFAIFSVKLPKIHG